MGFVVKAYQEVCADLIKMLEDLEESLEEITKAAGLVEHLPDSGEAVDENPALAHSLGFGQEK